MTDIYNDPEQIEKQEQIIDGSEIFGSSSSENILRNSDSDFDSENDIKPVKSDENQQVTDVEDPSEEIKDYKEIVKKLESYQKEFNETNENIMKAANEENHELTVNLNIKVDELDTKIKKYSAKLKQICIKQTKNGCSLKVFNELKNELKKYAEDDKISEMIIYNNMLNNKKLKKKDSKKIKDELEKIEENYFNSIGLPINEDMKGEEKSIINNNREFLKYCIYNNSDKINTLGVKDKNIKKKGFELACKCGHTDLVKSLLESGSVNDILDEKYIYNITHDLCNDERDLSGIIKKFLEFEKIRDLIYGEKSHMIDYINKAGAYNNSKIIETFFNDSYIVENIILSEEQVSSNSCSMQILQRDITCFQSGNNETAKVFLNNEAIREKMIKENYIQMHFESAINNKHLDTVKLMLNYEDVKKVILEKEENREKIFTEACEQGDLKLLGTLFNYMEENAISKEELINSALANAIKNNDIELFKNTIIRLHEIKSEELKTKTEVLKSKQEEFGVEKRAFFKKNSKKLEAYQLEMLETLEKSSNKTKNEINSLKNYEKKFDNITKKIQKQKTQLSDKDFSETLSDLAKDIINAFEGKEVSPRQPQ